MITKTIKSILLIGSVVLTSQLGFGQSTTKVNEADLERLVAAKVAMDKEGAFNDRYTIHIFQGENQEAGSVKSRYDALGLLWKSELKYEPPYHKVWIGKYRSRLEAERALLEVKKSFPHAFVMKPKG
ncbi:translation initiation factor IF-2 [Nonlabens antarcticus]|uniref:translation initiation factor IF-2 n=1 Tax=Nonlabens antarcticus TaxID=392714 RepID=UPI001E321DEC|nr:translation initiation factor IF-2 [Nonlabens antarcticus]